jgi:hypothetical protein
VEADQAAIDRLYGLPLDEFTSARDELATRLRREGDTGAATEVKRLRKPTVSAWALNQVSRNNTKRVGKLIDAGGRLREAQEQLLAGGGREPLDQAAEEERRLVAELAREAEQELLAAGRSASSSVQEKLRDTLHAAATDPEAREALSAGRLLREYSASGLGPLIEAGAHAGARGGGRDGVSARRVRQLEERLEKGRAEQRELEEARSGTRRELREARREATRAASALERAEAAEEEARARAERAGDRVADLETALSELQAEGRGS